MACHNTHTVPTELLSNWSQRDTEDESISPGIHLHIPLDCCLLFQYCRAGQFFIHTHVHKHTRIHIRKHLRICICTHTHTYSQTHAHTHLHAHALRIAITHTHTPHTPHTPHTHHTHTTHTHMHLQMECTPNAPRLKPYQKLDTQNPYCCLVAVRTSYVGSWVKNCHCNALMWRLCGWKMLLLCNSR